LDALGSVTSCLPKPQNPTKFKLMEQENKTLPKFFRRRSRTTRIEDMLPSFSRMLRKARRLKS